MRLENSSRFKSIFKVKPFEWCDLISGRTKVKGVVKSFIDIVRDRLPDGMSKCPLVGQMSAFNVSIKNKMMKIFPSGVYKISAHAYTKEDPNVVYFKILLKLDN